MPAYLNVAGVSGCFRRRSTRSRDARRIGKDRYGIVVSQPTHVALSASMLACHGARCRPLYMSESRSARGRRDRDPGKTADSLTYDDRSRWLCIHVVDGNENIVSTVVVDLDRHHIVADSKWEERG